MFKRFKVTGINEDPKKPKRNVMKYLLLGCVMALPAFALMKTGVLSMNKNVLAADKNKYDIVADLDGGKFDMGTTPEFVKMDNGKWLYKYKPMNKEEVVPTPVKNGYKFAGWNVDGNQPIQPEYKIPKWNNKNVELRANWKRDVSILLKGANVPNGDYDEAELVFVTKIASIPNFENVKTIKFIKGVPDKNGVDLSENQDGSIKASVSGNTLNIICENTIYANPNSAGLFGALENVENIIFDNFDTSKVTDMWGMFCDCSSLTNLDLNSFDTSKVKNMCGMFDGCSSLINLNLTSFNTSNVTDMYRMFHYCSGLSNLDLSNFNTRKVTNMGWMFNHCSNLTNLDLFSFNTSNVTDMNEMFYNCSNLTNLNVSNFNTSNVTDMSWMFNNCSNLTNLDVSKFNASKVTDMYGMFEGCSSLMNLDTSNFVTLKVTDMHGMFKGCSSLTNLDLSNFNTSNVTDMHWMFLGCSNLINLDISNFNTSNVTYMYNMFRDCRNLTNLNLSNFNTSKVAYMFNMFSGCSSLQTLDLSSFDTSNVTDMSCMFLDCSNLINLNLTSFNTSKVTNMRGMFSGCSKLTSEITIKNPNKTDYFYMFKNCSSDANAKFIVKYTDAQAKEVARNMVATKNPGDHVYLYEEPSTLLSGPEFNKLFGLSADNINTNPNVAELMLVKEINFLEESLKPGGIDVSSEQNGRIKAYFEGNSLNIRCDGKIMANTNCAELFADMGQIERINLYNFDSSEVKNMSYMFRDFSNIAKQDLVKLDTSNVINMQGMFSGSGIVKPNTRKILDTKETIDLSNFNTANVTDMSHMFESCSGLTFLDLSNFNTKNVVYASHMFDGCINLTSEITVQNSNITNYTGMFKDCSSDVNAKFIVKYTNPQTKEMAKKLVNTKNPGDHVYLYEEESSTLLAGPKFKTEVLNMDNFDKVRVINFNKNCPDLDGRNLSSGKYKSITGKIVGDTLNINCSGTIYLPYSIESMFDNFKNIESINFNDADFSKVRDASHAFGGCSSLKTIDKEIIIHDYTHTTGMFSGCANLSGSVYIEECNDLNTSGPLPIRYRSVFRGCASNKNAKFYIKCNQNSFTAKNAAKTYLDSKNPGDHVYYEGLDPMEFNQKDYTIFSWFYDLADSVTISLDNDRYDSYISIYTRELDSDLWKELSNHRNNLYADCVIANCRLPKGDGQLKIVYHGEDSASAAKYKGSEPMRIKIKYFADDGPEISYKRTSAPAPKPVTLTLHNGVMSQVQEEKRVIQNGIVGYLGKPELNPQYSGVFGGYYYDEACTKPVKPTDLLTQDTEIYARW